VNVKIRAGEAAEFNVMMKKQQRITFKSWNNLFSNFWFLEILIFMEKLINKLQLFTK
jgi:hypothetical protein